MVSPFIWGLAAQHPRREIAQKIHAPYQRQRQQELDYAIRKHNGSRSVFDSAYGKSAKLNPSQNVGFRDSCQSFLDRLQQCFDGTGFRFA
jgi:hypothetical protein